jgi:protein CLEC16A
MMSNNHLNSLITHKFDFSEDELLDYYITFLKALCLKFDKDIIQFFFSRVKKQKN